MAAKQNNQVLALTCDSFGRLEQILRDDAEVAANHKMGTPFHILVAEESTGKALRFLEALQIEGAVSNWELVVESQGQMKTFHFSGGSPKDQLLIVGSAAPGDLENQFQKMMRVCSVQANQIRQQVKQQTEAERRQSQQGDMIDDLSRLNNDLVSIQRELAKKNQELENLYEVEQRRTRELNALYHAVSSLLSSLELDPLLTDILEAAFEALPEAQRGLLLLKSADQAAFSIRASRGFRDLPDVNTLMPNIKNKIKEACSLQKPVILKLPPMISAVEENASSFGLIIPLLCGEGTRGVLILNIADSHQMDDADLRLWQAFGATSTAAIQNSLLHERIQQMAITDTLTGINNRRGFELLARQQIKHAQRYQHTMCFLMLDLDHFKNVNDHYGHPAGDQVLVEVSNRLADTLREADLLGRYGGEEFTVLLTNCSLDEGKSIGNRLLERVREKPVLTETGEIPVTLSIGLACGESRLTLEALIEKADQALYRAKQAGRDQMQT